MRTSLDCGQATANDLPPQRQLAGEWGGGGVVGCRGVRSLQHALPLRGPETVGSIFQNTGLGICENQLSKQWGFGELFFPLCVWKLEPGVSFSATFHLEDNLHLHKITTTAHLLNNYVRAHTG